MDSQQQISRRSVLAGTGGLVAAGALGPVLLAGCGSSGVVAGDHARDLSGVRPGGSVTVGTLSEIDGFYPPSNHWDETGYLYANTVYDPLVAIAADGSAQPYLAESVTSNADATVWTVTLRSGIRFHDGSPLDAAVLKANYDALKSSLLTGPALNVVASAEITGPMSVAYTCTGPNVDFPYYLATQVGYVVATSMIQASGGSTPPKPVGTGPFRFDSWDQNVAFRAVRNPDYWRPGLPYLDAITYKPIIDTVQREASLRTGQLDLIVSNDPKTINRFQGDLAVQQVSSLHDTLGEPAVDCVMFNCSKAPVDDVRVRTALAAATDQAQIQKIFGGGLTSILDGPFPQGSPYYSTTTYPTYDPSRARTLLAQYRAEKGPVELTLLTIPDPRVVQAVQVVEAMWSQVGAKVTISSVDQATLIGDFVSGNFQASIFEGFDASTPDINYVWWSTTQINPSSGVGLNFARYADPQVESEMLAARATSDPAKRAAAYEAVAERFAVGVPYVWLGPALYTATADARLRNFAGLTLPGGQQGKGFDRGVVFPTQIWVS